MGNQIVKWYKTLSRLVGLLILKNPYHYLHETFTPAGLFQDDK